MTAHRRPEIRFSDAPRATCRWCGEGIVHLDGARQGQPDPRRRWHPQCVEDYNGSDPREARRRVRKRDRGICAGCGVDTRKLKKAHRGPGSAQALRDLGFVPRRSLWELDHIVPLIDGGGHELANLQTLCTPCHKAKTAAEARDRAGRVAPPSVDDPSAHRESTAAHVVPVVHERRASKRRRKEPLTAILQRASEVNERVDALLRAQQRPGSRHEGPRSAIGIVPRPDTGPALQ